jgi:Carboxypeptidase regulatory-like domain
VEVTAPGAEVATSVEVDIAEGAESVSIELPDHEISGWVRDSAGQRLANGTVELFVVKGSVQTRSTDAAGAFRVRGIPAGVAILRARLHPSTSLRRPDPATNAQRRGATPAAGRCR